MNNQCRLLALNGHADPSDECLLSGVERTQVGHDRMSVLDPLQTLSDPVCCSAQCSRTVPGVE
jgi:hypothetical protein